MNTYKDLVIWQDSIKIVKEIYQIAEKLPRTEEFNLKLQLKRAVVSVVLNITEGKNRRTAKDFASFLAIASASLSEVESILIICEELGFFKINDDLKVRVKILNKKINSLRSKLIKRTV